MINDDLKTELELYPTKDISNPNESIANFNVNTNPNESIS